MAKQSAKVKAARGKLPPGKARIIAVVSADVAALFRAYANGGSTAFARALERAMRREMAAPPSAAELARDDRRAGPGSAGGGRTVRGK